MRVLFISPQPFFRVRGTPINIRNVVTALGRAGHEIDLLCYPFGEDQEIEGVRVLRSPRVPGIRDVGVGPSLAKIPLDLLMACKTFWLLLTRRYEVVHAVEESVFFAAWFNRWLFRRPRLVYDMDSCISDQLEYSGKVRSKLVLRLIEWMERRAIQRAAFTLTVCESLSGTVRRLAPDARVVQIEDAPLDDAFEPDEETAARLRAEIGPGPYLVYTGNFESYQGLDLLARAAGHMRGAGRLVLAGGQPEQIEALRALAAESGAGERFHFAGARPMEEMAGFYTLAQGLLSPRSEGTNTALKVYSYMQSGRPIVATDLPTHTQVLDQDCAFLADPVPEAYAAALDAALADPDEARTRGRRAKEKVEAEYSLPAFRRKVVAAYESLAD